MNAPTEHIWSGLDADQADGLACVVCGRDLRAPTTAPAVPVGRATQTGSQVFACAGTCADTATGHIAALSRMWPPPGWPAAADDAVTADAGEDDLGGREDAFVEVVQRYRDGERRLHGQRTACPHLVVVPAIADGRFTGGFVALHTPSGLFLLTEVGAVSPGIVTAAAATVAHLDWSDPDPQRYTTAGQAVGAYREAWVTALDQALDHAASEEAGDE